MAKQFTVNTASGGTLTTSLTSYYQFYSDATDFYGTENLTNHGSVTFSNPGGASMNGTNWLDDNGSDYEDIFTASAASVAMWVKFGTTGTAEILASKHDWPTTDQGWMIQRNTGNTLSFDLRNATGGLIRVTTTATFTDTASYHLIEVTYSGSGAASGVHIYYDNTDETLTVNNDTLSGSSDTSATIKFTIGGVYNGATPAELFTGSIHDYGRWEKVLSANERTDLWNGGSGQTMEVVTSNGNFFALF